MAKPTIKSLYDRHLGDRHKSVRLTERCRFYRGVRLIESQIKGVKIGRDQL